MRQLSSLATILVAASVLAACSSTPIAPEPKLAPVVDTPKLPPETKSVEQPKSIVTPVVVEAYLDPKSPISTDRSVYFDFDKYTMKPEGTRVVELHGKYLASKPALKVRIEGNTDDLGGKEYNLALGQKRADAVAKSLKVYGVTDAQMEAVSFGEEKPKATGADEASRAQNRRSDIAYPGK
ncbi:MAG: peptidoglycan-associated lipoprotein [Burkholderiales bacterium PBB4]|nr:MAG: peptidoglycan-associated lipoprotein [Burkholderiales bacterium PBB4]